MSMLTVDLVEFLRHKKAHSERTFGPSQSTRGICNHIRKELSELEQNPFDGEEWIDVLLLALDGLWRAGYTPEEAATLLLHKQLLVNEHREWPDWRKLDPDDPVEHLNKLKHESEGHELVVPSFLRPERCADCGERTYSGWHVCATRGYGACTCSNSMGGRVTNPVCPVHGTGGAD